MSRRLLIVLIVAFVATRGVTAFLADHPEHYAPSTSEVTGDPGAYENWANQILWYHLNPYSEIRIEYPPGSLPFVIGPGVEKSVTEAYRTRFVLLMLAVDLVGFLALLVLARRWGSMLGPWVWIAAIPLLGPITYNRLDLVPAVATILAVERFSARSWFGGGAWLGYGAVAKLYPAMFLPIALMASRRKQIVAGAAVVAGLFVLPYLGFLDELTESVLGYHTERGIQLESLWSFMLLLASKFGHSIGINYSFGALHVDSDLAPAMKATSQVLSVAIVAAGIWLAHRLRRSGGDASAPATAGIMFMTMAGTMAVGSVFSPQFMVWLAAFAAVVLCERGTWLMVPALTVLPVSLLTQLVYPFFYGRLIATEPAALVLLASRNFLVLFVAIEAFLALKARTTSSAEIDPTAAPQPQAAT
ncbi:MAG TPA: glycosyltransferase 87 family protein [Actinomycetota bacterium]|nr:glycosyltransferase 87 family protein [Actinomycetota bacterium]